MAATSALLLSVLKQGDHVVMSDVNYPGTAELARYTLSRFGIEVTAVDTSSPELVAQSMQPNTRLLCIETPANPILRLADISVLSEIAHANKAELADNSTIASPVAPRPVTLGADYVVHSLPKYIGGHGAAIGGAVLGRRSKLQHIDLEGPAPVRGEGDATHTAVHIGGPI